MKVVAGVLVLIVAVLHVGFLVLESVLWQQPIGLSVFDMTADEAAATAVLAFNQGVYNGFLAAGLVWGLVSRKRDVVVFFLLCVIVAGIVGAITAKPTILLIQAAPAAGALLVTALSGRWGAARPEHG